MTENQGCKTIREVFIDFREKNNTIMDAKIKSMNLIKKTNTLEIALFSLQKIDLESKYIFENYIERKFGVNNVIYDIEIENEDNNEEILHSNETEDIKELEEFDIEEKVILGRITKSKENKVKINEITSDNKRITIEGRVISVEAKETKTSKGMIIFDIYDGTGIITAKSFATDIKEGNEIANSIKNASGVKVIGKAGLDNFAGDVTVIANTIIEINGDRFPKLPSEDDSSPLILGLKPEIKDPLVKITNLNSESGNVCIDGEVILTEEREIKGGKILLNIAVYDGTGTVSCKAFLNKDNYKTVLDKIKASKGIKVSGRAGLDTYTNEISVMANTIIKSEGIKKVIREDKLEEKRVELSLHTQMSMMDGVTSIEDFIKRALKWGMKAIGITDGGSVQAFPEAHKMLGYDNKDIKVLYGMEGYLVADDEGSIFGDKTGDIDDITFCVLDLETTGKSYRTEKITEIGIMKVKNGKVIGEFDELVDPQKEIPDEVIRITNITNEMVKGKPTIDVILPKALEFIKDSVVVTHNTDFDIGWLRHNCSELGLEFNNTYLDTLRLAKKVYPNFTRYKLTTIADKLGIEVDVAHRALADVDTTVKVLNKMLRRN